MGDFVVKEPVRGTGTPSPAQTSSAGTLETDFDALVGVNVGRADRRLRNSRSRTCLLPRPESSSPQGRWTLRPGGGMQRGARRGQRQSTCFEERVLRVAPRWDGKHSEWGEPSFRSLQRRQGDRVPLASTPVPDGAMLHVVKHRRALADETQRELAPLVRELFELDAHPRLGLRGEIHRVTYEAHVPVALELESAG